MANPSNFRDINFTALLYETLTGFFSLNKAAMPTWGYKFCAACLAIFQISFANFVTFRNKENLIANCKFQVGQLTNVLNFMYDNSLKRVYIAQSISNPEFLAPFSYPALQYLSDFNSPPLQFWRTFNDQAATTIVTIFVPAGINLSDLTASVAQIALAGIPYKIQTI